MASTVLVAGASGGTGRKLLEHLADSDLHVRALTRSCRKISLLEDLGADDVLVGDLLDPADAATAVRGCDAVLCAVGTPPGLSDLLGEPLVDGEGVVNLVNAAVAADVDAFVFESSIGVGDSRDKMPAPFRLLLWRRLAAKNHAEAWLRSSGLSYTIVRPGRLTDGPGDGDVLVGEGGATVAGSVSRDDVARLMIAALSTPEARNRTFEVVSHNGARGTVRGLVDVDWQFPEDGEGDDAEESVEIAVTDEESVGVGDDTTDQAAA